MRVMLAQLRLLRRLDESGLDEGLEGILCAATRVLLAFLLTGLEILDGGVATDALTLAYRRMLRAVNVADENGRRIGKIGPEILPRLLHAFAVPSPRRLELDKCVLAAVEDVRLEVFLVELY